MATTRKTTRLRGGDILDVAEYHDGRYGAPGQPRQKKKKVTEEDIRKINALNKARRCRLRLLQYFTSADYFATWTYRVAERPPDMKSALSDFQKAIRKVRDQYKKHNYQLFWIRNIERGTRGAWHIHIVINRIPGAAEIITEAWEKGGVYLTKIKNSPHYDEDFTKLSNYMTKNQNTREKKLDGTFAAPRLKEASYNTSRNMPIPEPRPQKLCRWPREVKPKKGYYIARIHEGINPKTGYKYRRYTMIRLHRRI